MNFIVSASALLKKLQQIGGVINTNTVLPILEDFLLETEGNLLYITATDLETVMRVSLDVESSVDGKICIPAKILIESLKNIPEQPLTINTDTNYSVEITSDNGKYKLMGENPDNFPKEPEAEDAASLTISGIGLVTAISKTLFATSSDDLRPAMTGVFFELSKDKLQCVATDAHRLTKYARTDVTNTDETSFVVPKKPLNLLKSFVPNTTEALQLSYNKNHLFVSYGNSKLSCRLIDARFPDYKVVIPIDNPYLLTVNKTDFQNALKRVNVFANKTTNLVAIKIQGNELTITAQDVDFSHDGKETMKASYSGEDMAIAFNAKLLIEVVGAADTDEIIFELSTPNKAGIIKPTEQAENEDLLMLVMPLMINY